MTDDRFVANAAGGYEMTPEREEQARAVARLFHVPDEFLLKVKTSRRRRWWQRHVTRRP